MNRRDFLKYSALFGITQGLNSGCSNGPGLVYQAQEFGSVTLMHLTDCHAQLLPVYFREPLVNLGVGKNRRRPPHLTGRQFLEYFGITANSAKSYAYTCLNFIEAAELYGRMGGFAHLATLIGQVRDARGIENTMLLDGGDSWQGSATALWTEGRDMIEATNLLGVDAMTGHWEFTYGSRKVLENIAQFKGQFVAQNISLTEEAQFEHDLDSGAVFKPYMIRELKNARIAVIGQAFPYTPVANPRRFIPDWRFGIREQNLQNIVNTVRSVEKPDAVVLLSHNGMDVDLKLASRLSGIDIILGGHTHDVVPDPVIISNPGGKTWVTNAGSHGKFLAVLDLDIRSGKLTDMRYRLLPVFSNLLEPDDKMQKLIETIRHPYIDRLHRSLAVTEDLLYRRDNFYGTFDQVILDALRVVKDADLALSPGFRWGASLLPGQHITLDDVMNMTAITYPETYVRSITGQELKDILEDVCDNLFNRDPYYRQGGDMVRVGGFSYHCNPYASAGKRISSLRLVNGELISAGKYYEVAGWATTGQASTGEPIWEVVSNYLKDKKTIHFEQMEKPVVKY